MDQNPIADIADTIISRQRNSRIPFAELCGFYAALVWGAPLGVVVEAAGLDRSTVAHLRSAGTHRSGQMRYPKVAQEFARLGKAEFSTKYLTAPIRDRLRVAKDRIDRAAIEPRERRINPSADAYAGRQPIKDPTGGPDVTVTIEFDRGDRKGWTWREYAGRPEPLPGSDGAFVLRGDPRHEERRFVTSTEAREFCRLRFCPTWDEIGSPEQEATGNDDYFYGTIRTLRA